LKSGPKFSTQSINLTKRVTVLKSRSL